MKKRNEELRRHFVGFKVMLYDENECVEAQEERHGENKVLERQTNVSRRSRYCDTTRYDTPQQATKKAL